jgi:hypothetical protein
MGSHSKVGEFTRRYGQVGEVAAVTTTTITIEGEAQVLLPNATPVPPSHDTVDERFSYSVKRAAEVTDISVRKLTDYIAAGQLKVRRNGSYNIILRDDLIAFLHSLPVARTEG